MLDWPLVGGWSRVILPQAKKIAAAAKAAGMNITNMELPGGHDFIVWAAGYEQALPWLGTRLGLVP